VRILIAEDDYTSRKFLQRFLSRYGECDLVVDGMEAVEAFVMSLESGTPYDLVCLDIMMPMVDGLTALKTLRQLELQRQLPESKRARIIMTTALDAVERVNEAFGAGASGYAVKPIDTDRMTEVLRKLGLMLDITV